MNVEARGRLRPRQLTFAVPVTLPGFASRHGSPSKGLTGYRAGSTTVALAEKLPTESKALTA